MRSVERIHPFLERMENIWKTVFPDWRFGQFMYNLEYYLRSEKGVDIFTVEDDKLIDLMDSFVAFYSAKRN